MLLLSLRTRVSGLSFGRIARDNLIASIYHFFKDTPRGIRIAFKEHLAVSAVCERMSRY